MEKDSVVTGFMCDGVVEWVAGEADAVQAAILGAITSPALGADHIELAIVRGEASAVAAAEKITG